MKRKHYNSEGNVLYGERIIPMYKRIRVSSYIQLNIHVCNLNKKCRYTKKALAARAKAFFE